jgi:hypothetical protein
MPPLPCMQWEFDRDRLEEVVSQLVGQHILVGGPPVRPADEVVALSVWLDSPSVERSNDRLAGWRVIRLVAVNELTKETATSVLHLLHHFLVGDTYIKDFMAYSTYYPRPTLTRPQNQPPWRQMDDWTHLNPVIFIALRGEAKC